MYEMRSCPIRHFTLTLSDMKKLHLSLVVLAFILSSSISVASGLILKMESVEAESGEKIQVELKSMEHFLRMDNQGDIIIFNRDRNELIIASEEDRVYFVIDREQLQEMKQAMAAMQQQMEEALAQVPTAQREQVRRMMAGHMPDMDALKLPKVSIEETGKKKKVNDQEATQALVKADGELTAELWLVPWGKIEGGEGLKKNLQGMAAFMVNMMESIPQFGAHMDASEASWMQAMQEVKGLPILSTSYERGEEVESTTVQSIQSATLSESDFQPPASFRRQAFELPGM